MFLVFSTLTYAEVSTYQNISINGERKFVKQVKSALELIYLKSPQDFRLISDNVKLIKESPRSGMRADANPPTYELNGVTAFYSLTWCAASIAHDAYHSKLYHEFKKSFGEPVPLYIWTGQNVEIEAIKYQIQVAQKIGMSKYELDYLKSLDGSHYDLNNNGIYDEDDYQRRNW